MENKYKISYNIEVPAILKKNKISILLTTYQPGKLIIISPENDLLLQKPISFKKPMGIAIQGNKLAVACQDEIIIFSKNENVGSFINKDSTNFDSIFLQRSSYHTGTLDIHDLDFGDGLLWGVNTLFSCLSIFDINHSFKPKWKPNFISNLVPEDKCHLNGMEMVDSLPKYATSLSIDDTKQGWRINKLNTGVLIEVPTGEIILSNLSMPHSPRIYKNELYLLESGKGTLVKVNTTKKIVEVIYNFNCFIRGLAFSNGIAFIGKSLIRDDSVDFNHLEIKENSKNAGVIMFNLETMSIIGEINYEKDIQELYDIQILENSLNPIIISNELKEYNDIITFPGNVFCKNTTI